jgi:hypothetical protein
MLLLNYAIYRYAESMPMSNTFPPHIISIYRYQLVRLVNSTHQIIRINSYFPIHSTHLSLIFDNEQNLSLTHVSILQPTPAILRSHQSLILDQADCWPLR